MCLQPIYLAHWFIYATMRAKNMCAHDFILLNKCEHKKFDSYLTINESLCLYKPKGEKKVQNNKQVYSSNLERNINK